uniref:Uncharacterized protein n=1 Tax=Populus trichocarpa TaxID=3694 RepID=B9HH06_POPTR
MASPTSAPLFQQPVSVRWILSKTLTGFWLEASDAGDFAGSSVAPLPDELDGSPCLLGLICPVHCLGDGQFNGCPHCSACLWDCSLCLCSAAFPVFCWSCSLSGWLTAEHDIEPSRGRCCCFLALAFWFDGGLIRLAYLDGGYGSQQFGRVIPCFMRAMLADAWSLVPCRGSALIASSRYCWQGLGLMLSSVGGGCSVPGFSRWGFVCLYWLFGCLVIAPA